MLNRNTLGLILSERYDVSLGALTNHRTLAAVYFGGRYRLVDFALSNMVNSGIFEVGIITQSKYRSLMEHLGSGRHWDLARKKGGLTILPPFVGESKDAAVRGTVDVLYSALEYIESSDCKYLVLTTADVVGVIDYGAIIKAHEQSGADITVCCKKTDTTTNYDRGAITFEVDDEGRIIQTIRGNYGDCTLNQFLGTSVIEREFLINLIRRKHSQNKLSFVRNVLQEDCSSLNIRPYFEESYAVKVNSLESYYNASMDLLDSDIRNCLFRSTKPILTKVRDEVPAKYGLEAKVVNSIVADGTIIDGTVENCVISRGVRVAKGAIVKNSIIMQGTTIGENAQLSYIIADRDCSITDGRLLAGYRSYPIIISKESKV